MTHLKANAVAALALTIARRTLPAQLTGDHEAYAWCLLGVREAE